jgi:signal transduction histidine kinase
VLKINAQIKPYTTPNECGDFYDFIELDKYFLLVIGDIGGHGSPRVYNIATKIRELIEKNKKESLKELLTLIHSQDYLKTNGMAIFLAQVYKELPIMSYCAIGNTKSFLYREKNFIHLKSQSGILGYDIPRTIKTNLIKLLKNDTLIISTDGVSLHDSQIEPLLRSVKDINILPKKIVANYGKKDDDSLCFIIKFENLKNKNFSAKFQEENLQINSLRGNKRAIKNFNKHSLDKTYKDAIIKEKKSSNIHNIKLLDNDNLIVENLQKKLLNFSIDKLDSIVNFGEKSKVKIKTFLTEALNYSSVDIYLDENLLQLYIHNIKPLAKTLDFLFNNFYIFKDNSCIIHIRFNGHLNSQNIDILVLKEMLELGLNDEDYRKLKQTQENLDKLAKQSKLASMGEMIGNIAHQWRQPLSVISTIATGIEVKKKFDTLDDTDLEKEMDSIMKQVNYLSHTIDDFKNFIKGDREFLPISIKQVLEDTISLVEASLKNNYITLITDISHDIKIEGNKNELEQALINIINNSKDVLKESSKEDKYIFISAKKIEDDNLEIKILDNGGGIDENIIGRIFEPYFTTKHQSVGTGLGLSMAEKILRERYNASIEANNEEFVYKKAKYKGACFTIIFPVNS